MKDKDIVNEILLSEWQLNADLKLKNRIVMAPMTRAKADAEGNPTPPVIAYYAKRADAGLIVTEGTVISPEASGYLNVPGIYQREQIKNWQKVTQAVHEKGGRIFLQIWHVGRVSHPEFLKGQLPLSPSETMMQGRIPRTNGLTYGKSRAATLEEIEAIIDDYAKGAERACEAGFDGVEIHGANGYLVDQFLHYDTNKRTDLYGGNPVNMARFALQVVKACTDKIGSTRVGLRLSPGAYLNEIQGDVRDQEVFSYLLDQLNTTLPVAYVHTGNFDDTVVFKELGNQSMTAFLRQHYQGTLIACGNYTPMQAAQAMQQRKFDLIAFGRPFIANPDLIQKLRLQQPLQSYDAKMLNELI